MRTNSLAGGIAAVLALAALPGAASAASVTLSGTIRDFCAPSIAGACTQLSDFEGAIPGVVTGMVQSTLGADGLPVAGANINAGASSATNFAKWYRDTAGYNLSQAYSVTLVEGAPGVYAYSSNSFFPVDGQLYGNQGRGHNYHFTLQLGGLISFTDAAQTFSFFGDDDLWVFVDDKLFIDLGGVHGGTAGSFTGQTLLDAGLLPGQDYSLDIFFAERHTSESNFAITTSLTLKPPVTDVPEPGSLALLGAGLAGLGFMRRRKG